MQSATYNLHWVLVGTGGLEPPTSCMSSRRSNQLSYAPRNAKYNSPGGFGGAPKGSPGYFFPSARSTALSSIASPAGGTSSNSKFGSSTTTSGGRPSS